MEVKHGEQTIQLTINYLNVLDVYAVLNPPGVFHSCLMNVTTKHNAKDLIKLHTVVARIVRAPDGSESIDLPSKT